MGHANQSNLNKHRTTEVVMVQFPPQYVSVSWFCYVFCCNSREKATLSELGAEQTYMDSHLPLRALQMPNWPRFHPKSVAQCSSGSQTLAPHWAPVPSVTGTKGGFGTAQMTLSTIFWTMQGLGHWKACPKANFSNIAQWLVINSSECILAILPVNFLVLLEEKCWC